MKVYKGYELIKEIAEGNIKDQATFNLTCRNGKQEYFYLKEGESLFRDIKDAFGKINGNIINIMSDFSLKEIAEADFELIEDQTIDIENIKEFKRDEEMEEIFKYTGEEGEKSNLHCFSLWAAHELIDKINELVLATKQNHKEIQSIKEKM